MITRTIQSVIEGNFFKGKAIILTGARQVGKTTLMEQLQKSKTLEGMSTMLLNCDEPNDRQLLTEANSADLSIAVRNARVVIIDEAQRVKNIGVTLKLLIDKFKDIQFIVTGSSSLQLADELAEPLTGRKYEYHLFPVSSQEIVTNTGWMEASRMLESRLIYGSYPDILYRKDDVKELLFELTKSYLYKDLLAMKDVRKPAMLDKLIVALALQIGSLVSFNELAQIIQTDLKTVERYIDLLEKCFVVFRLDGLSRNLRNELKKSKKIYFYDNGIRNAVIQNFAPLSLRQDVGALWENFFVAERLKYNHYNRRFVKSYFWRTQQQQEIDLVEETDGLFTAFELKWNETRKVTFPESFVSTYQPVETKVVSPKNYLELLS